MKIVTYNLQWNGAGKQDWHPLLNIIDPDILLVQESLEPLSRLKDRSEWKEITGYNWGSAIYVKKGSLSRVEIQHDYNWLPGWLVGVDVEGGLNPQGSGKTLRLFSLHAPPRSFSGCDYPSTVKRMLDVVGRNRGDGDLIVGGDFNLLSLGKRLASETREGGKPWKVTKAEREIHERLEGFGLINCWQTSNPGKPLGRTLRYAKNPNTRFHCDGIFVPAAWRDALITTEILEDEDWMSRSDHNPVAATIMVNEKLRNGNV